MNKPYYNNHGGIYVRAADPRFDVLMATAAGAGAASMLVDALNAEHALMPKVKELLKHTANNGDPWAEKAAADLVAALAEQGWV